MDYNQMSLHAAAANQSCLKAESSAQLGRVETSAADCSQTMGCAVAETKSDSYGDDFAKAGGGVFVLNMDGTGIRIWFWSRNDVPGSIKTANRTTNVDFDLSTWGTPSAAYLATSGCDARQAIVPQHIVFDISLCGSWAGSPEVYNNTCPTKGSCVVDNVIGPGNPVYNDAYFEINYLRAYFLTNATIPAGVSGVSGSSKLSRWIFGAHVTIFSLYFVMRP
ncbi:hypothetical protein BDN72DRAFT_58476 [Pluteus cervinus]|uniref:Uncharacterized protein n=1 Tax=Pluteus cervinus TaxID=181527 RepID=A0ACD3B874_9AGAR|nr:hypothetical protein BDN72DRAFT_58476 [Pluteus cervinus]